MTTKFGQAFQSARKSGKKTFKFNGKLYTTETREEKQPKNVPVPAKRPDTPSATVKASATADQPTSTASATAKVNKPVAVPKAKAAIAAAVNLINTGNTSGTRPKDTALDANKYKGTPQAERDRGDLSGPRNPPEKKPVADAPKKKKQGPFGLGGLFNLSKS
jgi:hypothetical protein